MDWIDVKDRLPEEGQEVIYYFEYTGISIGIFKRQYIREFDHTFNCFSGSRGFLCDDVTHWMPLPEPPKVKPIDK